MRRALRVLPTISVVLGAIIAVVVGVSWFTPISFDFGTNMLRRGLRIRKGYAVLLAPDVTRKYRDRATWPSRLPRLLARTKNESVHWDTNHGLLHPWIQSDPKFSVSLLDPDELPQLLPALNDPDRFVLAHVLPSGAPRAGRIRESRNISTTEYQGLNVLGPLNAPHYDTSQIPILREAWQRSLYQPRVQVMWLPLYWPVVLLVVPPLALSAAGAIRRARQARMVGRCRNCFYDLRGNTSGVCPECGVVIAEGEKLQAEKVNAE